MTERKPARTPKLEWIAAAIGLVLTLAAIGLVAREALAGDPTPPDITVRLLEIRPVQNGYLVTVAAENLGGRPAAQLLVEGELGIAGSEPEIAETVFDYVPGRSIRRGGLFFQGDPRGKPLTLQAKGFVEP